MILRPGWLKRQLDATSKEVESWPKEYRERMRRYVEEHILPKPISDEEMRMRKADSQKYGNY